MLGIAEATLSRWETGAQIQQRSLDRLLRLYYASEEVWKALADERGLCKLGLTTAHTAAPVRAPSKAAATSASTEV